MLVIKRKSLTRVFVPLQFDGMRVVIAQNPFATGRVQRQRVPYSVGNILAGRNFPSLDLDPIAVLLIDDLVMEVKKRTDLVLLHGLSISPDDIFPPASPFMHPQIANQNALDLALIERASDPPTLTD